MHYMVYAMAIVMNLAFLIEKPGRWWNAIALGVVLGVAYMHGLKDWYSREDE
jgi:hypothetical protein